MKSARKGTDMQLDVKLGVRYYRQHMTRTPHDSKITVRRLASSDGPMQRPA